MVRRTGVVKERQQLSLDDLSPYLSVVMVRVNQPGPDVAARVAKGIAKVLGRPLVPEAIIAAVADKFANGKHRKVQLRGLIRDMELDDKLTIGDEKLIIRDVGDIPKEGSDRRAELEGRVLEELARRLRSQEKSHETFATLVARYGFKASEFKHRLSLSRLHPAEAPSEDVAGLSSSWLLYDELHSPVWANEGIKYFGQEHTQVVVVSVLNGYAAINASEQTAREAIIRHLRDGSLSTELGNINIALVEEEVLSRAFMTGATRLLWMHNSNPPTDVQAEAKQLAGPNLVRTLGLGDQTFFYSAGLAENSFTLPQREWALAVGVAPQRSTVWAGHCSSWTDYSIKVGALLRRLEEAAADQGHPLEMLVRRVSNVALEGIEDPYDLSLASPGVFGDGSGALAEFCRDVSFFGFDPLDGGKLDFTVAASLNGSYLGRLHIGLVRRGGSTDLTVTAQPIKRPSKKELSDEAVNDLGSADRKAYLERVAEACVAPGWLTIRYESGHSWNDGVFFRLAERADLTFDGWRWRDFGRTEVTKEKPTKLDPKKASGKSGGAQEVVAPEKIGARGDNSLFTWVVGHWPDTRRKGWLACDDGSGEIADFVHFDARPADKGFPTLTLIHVKASHSPSARREISTTDFEVVVGQAIKNLRLLGVEALAERLRNPPVKRQDGVAAAVWHDGKRSSREKMAKAVSRTGVRHRRRVVVLQPRVVQDKYEEARADLGSPNPGAQARRLLQLETLLLEADSACHDLGATFEVVGAKKA